MIMNKEPGRREMIIKKEKLRMEESRLAFGGGAREAESLGRAPSLCVCLGMARRH